MKHDYDILLARYFGGSASEHDMEALEQWLAASAENQAYFDQMTQLYARMAGPMPTMPSPNTEKAKGIFEAYISKHRDTQPVAETKHHSISRQWMLRAASIALFIVVSVSAWHIFLSEHELVLASQTSPKQDVLPDQTQVKLSGNSKITYSSNYGKKSRTIQLEGEASFDVGHAGKGTLQVRAGETFIEDIGTVFAVSAYPDSNYISVKVSEGEVHFFTKNNKGLNLSAHETGVYNKQTKTFKLIAHKLDTLAAGSMHVEFQGMVLRDAIDIIGNAYNVMIRVDEKNIGERKITVNFDGEDVDMVLQIIAQTLDLNLKKDAHGYLLSNNKKLNE